MHANLKPWLALQEQLRLYGGRRTVFVFKCLSAFRSCESVQSVVRVLTHEPQIVHYRLLLGRDHFQSYPCLVGVTNPSFDRMQQEQASTIDRSPKCFVIVHNVAKKHNIGTLARSCTAFNVVQARLLSQVVAGSLLPGHSAVLQMCLVGSRHYNTFGSHGSAAHVPLAYFVTLDECCAWLRTHEGEDRQSVL